MTDQSPTDARTTMAEEMQRTAFLKKAVSAKPVNETLDDAIAYFKEHGYRAGRTGRPNQIFVMGGREGALPRVNAEILAQGNVGKGKTTMLTISGFGERLRDELQAYVTFLAEQRRAIRQQQREHR